MATSPIPMFTGSQAPGVANPLSTNPTGAQGGGSTGGGVPILNYGSGAGVSAPTPGGQAPPGASPTNTLAGLVGTGGNPGLTTPSATGENGQTINNGQVTQRQGDRTLGELQDYYGEGIGSYIYSLMQTGGINTNLLNSVDTQQIAAMQPQLNSGAANLNALMGAQGVSGNSSTSALANSNYWSNATTQENNQISQNYLQQYDQGQQLLQSILGGVLNTNKEGTANESNFMDDITGALGLGQSGTSLFSSLSNIIPGLG